MTKIQKETRHTPVKVEIVNSFNPNGVLGELKFNTVIPALMFKTTTGWVFFPAKKRGEPLNPTNDVKINARSEDETTLASAPPPSYSDLRHQLHTVSISPTPTSEGCHHYHQHHHYTSPEKKKTITQKIKSLIPRTE